MKLLNIPYESGIYAIVNTENGKRYIGSAVDMRSRAATHSWAIRNQRHHSILLQRSCNKYGFDNFIFTVLCFCAKEDLIRIEQLMLDFYQPEYNIVKTAGSCLGSKGTPESNKKKSENHAMRGKFGENNPTSKPIYQYTTEGSFVRKWYGSGEIQRELGYDAANIRMATKTPRRTPYGFRWSSEFLGDTIPPVPLRDRSATCKEIVQLTPDGELVKIWKSQKEAMIAFGKKSNGDISKGLRHKRIVYGFMWRYKNEYSENN